ncbi:TPA: serine hydrolase [Legionella anisa]
MKAKFINFVALTFKSNSKESADVEMIRKKANIEQISVATVRGNDTPVTQGYGDVNKDTVFGAASLSKPVFTYLVLKLAEARKLSLDMKRLNDILPFMDFCQQHRLKWKEGEEINEEDIARINAFTPEMILSHKTGFDLNNWTNEVNHQFEPGQEYYRYSGLPLFYLQKVIEKLHEPKLALMPENDSFEENTLYVSINPPNLRYTIVDITGVGRSSTIDLNALNCNLQKLTDVQELNPYLPKILEEVAKRGHTANLDVLAKKYVFTPLHMDHSSFGKKPCAANTLTTTAEDYARFVQAWMNDNTLNYAFNPQIRMTQDPWAKATVSDHQDLNYVAECLGFQLEVDENGKPLTAFKTGDMGPWRGWVAIDLTGDFKERKATVFFAKGPDEGNGHILAEALIKPYFQLEHAIKWFKEKYGFATGVEENWEALQKARCERGMSYQKHSPKLSQSQEDVTAPSDSTQKMINLMPPATQTVQEQKLETPKNELVQEVDQVRNEDKTQEEGKFNPSPFSNPYSSYY